MRKQLYKLHHTLSIIIAIPVILWAGSGILHPVMTNVRPAISSQQLDEKLIDSTDVSVTLQQALKSRAVKSFRQVHLVYIDTVLFYQVQTGDARILYVNTKTGDALPHGDTVYAKYLARQFLLAGKQPIAGAGSEHHDHAAMIYAGSSHRQNTKAIAVEHVTSFDDHYTGINRLLPVYKVSFDREDGVAVYVDTRQSRFAFATNRSRQLLSALFGTIHLWGWLSFAGRVRILVEILFAGLAFATSALGVIIFFSSRGVRGERNPVRRNHRYTAIAVSLFTLMFAFSGCFHATARLGEKREGMPVMPQLFSDSVDADISKIIRAAATPVTDMQLAKIDGSIYWRVVAADTAGRGARDLMDDQRVTTEHVRYIDAADYTILPYGDARYAKSLARYFGVEGSPDTAVMITHFTEEYGFADKVLPVWKIAGDRAHYFVETASAGLSKVSRGGTSYEELSFAFLHKHEFLGGFGKRVKDISTTFWAFAQIAMVAFGVILFVKLKRRT